MFNILVMYAYHAGPLQFTQMYFIPYLVRGLRGSQAQVFIVPR